MKDLKQYYCEVTQDEANEAKELLVKAGEKIWKDEFAFAVLWSFNKLRFDSKECWFVGFEVVKNTKLTYQQFKQMLIDKIKENEINA